MAASLEGTMFLLWKQAFGWWCKRRDPERRIFPNPRTSACQLREVDFQFEGQKFRSLEQNPKTASRWAQLARQGKKVMQFLQQRRYIGCCAWSKGAVYGKSQLWIHATTEKGTWPLPCESTLENYGPIMVQ